MKLLHMNLYFKLSDDFVGTFQDALKEMINYRQDKNEGENPIDVSNISDSEEFLRVLNYCTIQIRKDAMKFFKINPNRRTYGYSSMTEQIDNKNIKNIMKNKETIN